MIMLVYYMVDVKKVTVGDPGGDQGIYTTMLTDTILGDRGTSS